MSIRSSISLVAMLAGALSLAGCGEDTGHEAADLVLKHGTIYTVDDLHTVAEAVAVRDGAIVYVGSDDGVAAYIGKGTRVEDLGGKAVFPGFTDSHVHLPDGGASIIGLGLGGIESAEEVLARTKAFADAHPDMPVIFGAGWELSLFPGANPSREMLDAVVSDRPVILQAADGHNSWANTKAFEAAGITAATEDPQNGRFERDANGNPTGTIREAAQALIMKIVPEPTLEDVKTYLAAGIDYQLANGITASIDAAIMADKNEEAYLAAAENPDLPERVRVSLLASDHMVSSIVTTDNVPATLETLEKRRQAYRDRSKGRVDAEAVKIFVDGVIENYTAAMVEPYVGTPMGPEYKGDMNLTADALNAYVTALDAAGFQVHMHALGDQAVRSGLDAIEAAENTNGTKDRRPHLAHLEVVRDIDIQRFAGLNATANLQTLWHFRDAYITDLTEPYLPDDVKRWIYPAKSFKLADTRIAWGSDWPVSTSNPFMSIEVAVTRKDPNDPASTPLVPEEALSVNDMIKALTMGGAYLMNQDAIRGSLEVGKRADIIIVDADPYKVAPEAISDIQVLETFVDGKSVFKR